MKIQSLLVVSIVCFFCTGAFAEPEATAASGAAVTGICNDGTEYTGATKRGSCRGHKGVKDWYADKPASAAATVTTPKPSVEPTAAPAPAEPTKAAEPAVIPPPPQTKPSAQPASAPAQTAPAPAAGSGKVWVNTKSKIYHCEGTKFYGHTKAGEYMPEADALAKGNKANRNKACK
jgi:hypothetical protein